MEWCAQKIFGYFNSVAPRSSSPIPAPTNPLQDRSIAISNTPFSDDPDFLVDLCWISAVNSTTRERITHCHHVLGLDVSSFESIERYVLSVPQAWDTPVYSVESCTYCSWDIFSQSDLRFVLNLVEIEGKLCYSKTVHSVDKFGKHLNDVTEINWLGARLSNLMRAFNGLQGMYLNSSSPLHILPRIKMETVVSFVEFLFVSDCNKLGSRIVLQKRCREEVYLLDSPCQLYGVPPVVWSLYHCLLSHVPNRVGFKVCAALMPVCPPTVVLASLVSRTQLQDPARALSMLNSVMDVGIENEHVLMETSQVFLHPRFGDTSYQLAVDCAKMAAKIAPGNPWTWLVLAESLSVNSCFGGALDAMNEGCMLVSRIAWIGMPADNACQINSLKSSIWMDPVVERDPHATFRTRTYALLAKVYRATEIKEAWSALRARLKDHQLNVLLDQLECDMQLVSRVERALGTHRVPPSVTSWASVAEAAYRVGSSSVLEFACRYSLELEQSSLKLSLFLLNVYVDTGKVPEAIQIMYQIWHTITANSVSVKGCLVVPTWFDKAIQYLVSRWDMPQILGHPEHFSKCDPALRQYILTITSENLLGQ